MLSLRLVSALMLIAGGLTVAGQAQAFSSTPACETSGVVQSVVGRFGAHSRGYLGYPMTIVAVDRIRENRLLLRAETYPVERRYCSAAVTTSDGERRKLWYLIENSFGFAGLGSSVEYCVSGLDPWHVYGMACKSLR